MSYDCEGDDDGLKFMKVKGVRRSIVDILQRGLSEWPVGQLFLKADIVTGYQGSSMVDWFRHGLQQSCGLVMGSNL
ncbi:hypothetical protein RYX36_033868 [Vicia faba]